MGSAVSHISDHLWGRREAKILMVGLDDSGKTTIIYKLKTGKVVTTIPTVGFIIETINWMSIDFTIWELGGTGKIRPTDRYSFRDSLGIIFVVDSADRDRMVEAREELQRKLRIDELKDALLLVFANKSDLPTAMEVKEITKVLELNRCGARKWFIQSTCATTGDGLAEGLDWLANALKRDWKK